MFPTVPKGIRNTSHTPYPHTSQDLIPQPGNPQTSSSGGRHKCSQHRHARSEHTEQCLLRDKFERGDKD